MQREKSGNQKSPPIFFWVCIVFFMFSCNKTSPSTAPSLPTPASGTSPGTQATLPSTSKASESSKGRAQRKGGSGQPKAEAPLKTEEKTELSDDQSNKTAQLPPTVSQDTPKTEENTDSEASPSKAPPIPGDPIEPVQTPEERRAQVEREFDKSLAEFEKRLLKEKEILSQDRPKGASAGGSSIGGSAGLAGSASSSAGMAGPSDQGGKNKTTGGGSGQALGTGLHKNGGRVPADIPDGNDDDIVARQLREAAMQEDDPALREKLWQEYRNYKNGTGKGKTPRQQ